MYGIHFPYDVLGTYKRTLNTSNQVADYKEDRVKSMSGNQSGQIVEAGASVED